MEEKYDMLLKAISKEGELAAYIKAGDFQKIYNEKYPKHPDYRGFNWNKYIKNKAINGEIYVYKIKSSGKNHYYVLRDKLGIFLKSFPKGVSVV